jgi:hypothetical protein
MYYQKEINGILIAVFRETQLIIFTHERFIGSHLFERSVERFIFIESEVSHKILSYRGQK